MNERHHNLPALFRSEERITLLRTVLTTPACTVQQITTKTGLSKGLVSPYLALMEREGILGRKGRTYMLKFSPLTVAVKRLLNIDRIAAVFIKPAWASGNGLYGSWAEGTNTEEESDVDLWVFCKDLPCSPGCFVPARSRFCLSAGFIALIAVSSARSGSQGEKIPVQTRAIAVLRAVLPELLPGV